MITDSKLKSLSHPFSSQRFTMERKNQMERGELLARLKQQKQQLEQELTQQIMDIEVISASIQAIEGKEITCPIFPPQGSTDK